jgi:hypothetical protein
MPARPMDGRNVTGPGTSRPFVGAQEVDAPPEMPPPSNGAPEDCDKLVKPEQPVFPKMEPALAGFHHASAAAGSRGVHQLNAMASSNPGVSEDLIPVSGSEAGMCNSPDTSLNKR